VVAEVVVLLVELEFCDVFVEEKSCCLLSSDEKDCINMLLLLLELLFVLLVVVEEEELEKFDIERPFKLSEEELVVLGSCVVSSISSCQSEGLSSLTD
jgi:hypothetical protein